MKLKEAKEAVRSLAKWGDSYGNVDIGDLRERTIALAIIVTAQSKLINKLLKAQRTQTDTGEKL